MLNLCQLTDSSAGEALLKSVDQLNEEDSFEFLINRDPDPIIKWVWEQRPGSFTCYLEEKKDNELRVRVERKKSCCGSCH